MTQTSAHWHEHRVVGGPLNGRTIKVEPGQWEVHAQSHAETDQPEKYFVFIEIGQGAAEDRHWLLHESIQPEMFGSAEYTAIRSLLWSGKIKWGA